MRRIALFLIVALFAALYFAVPYVSNATAVQQAQANSRAPLSLSGSLLIPTAVAPVQPAYRQVRGLAGFWRLAQDRANVWWFISPTGKQEFLNTVTTVQPVQDGRLPNAVRYVSNDWDGKQGPADLDRWANKTVERIQSMGFKGLGAWCNPAFHNCDVPMSQDLNLWAWVNDPSKRFYNPDWADAAEEATKVQVKPLRDNKSLVGYFIDNELDWGDGFSGPGAYFDNLPTTDPNRKQVVEVVHEIWPTVSDFNLAWNSKIAQWSDLETWHALPREQSHAYEQLSTAWLSHLAHDYFRVTTGLIRRYDPNHLILGVRFKGFAPEEVVAASRDFTDAQSLNYYVADAHLDADMFRMMYEKSGQPIIISEYSFHAMDGQSHNANTVGFSGQVPDQQARADGYRLMTTRLARVPYIVGADWFQWSDEPPAGRPDGEDVNFGIVDVHDAPYKLLVDSIKATTPLLNPLHSRSSTDPNDDVWRLSYAVKPVMHVPYLSTLPAMDGNFSKFPSEMRLDRVRREQTVGLDRVPEQTPDVYLGWTASSLYVGIEVYDKHVETAPASAWWWTRDNVELFVATHPISPEQTTYDVNCHQFFVVPMNGAKKAPVVGQWHRDGDALKDNIIPDPQIQKLVKIFPDHYTVELLIPAKAMHGFDPGKENKLAFNLHVRDFNCAADFFWSAPKATRTELRPNTWGTLYLDPPASTIAANTGMR